MNEKLVVDLDAVAVWGSFDARRSAVAPGHDGPPMALWRFGKNLRVQRLEGWVGGDAECE